ncbi:MAG: hypothetical protein QF464_11525, partial [Myxococcota bacterium]|nr:hypothetical protein [Myxococcota bacterium]
LAFANTRRLARENPATVVGDEAQETADIVQAEREQIQQARAAKRQRTDRIEADLDSDRLDRARDRSQNLRRRLASSYGQRPNTSQGIAEA